VKTYRAILTTDAAAPIDPGAAVTLAAATPQAAATVALASAHHDHPARRAYRDGLTVRAWVWERNGPTHPNGWPICVHGLDLRRASAEAPAHAS
jgi:hypothetical protein